MPLSPLQFDDVTGAAMAPDESGLYITTTDHAVDLFALVEQVSPELCVMGLLLLSAYVILRSPMRLGQPQVASMVAAAAACVPFLAQFGFEHEPPQCWSTEVVDALNHDQLKAMAPIIEKGDVLHRVDLNTGARSRIAFLWGDSIVQSGLTIAPDSRTAVVQLIRDGHSPVVIDLRTGHEICAAPRVGSAYGESWDDILGFSADSRTVYLSAKRGRESAVAAWTPGANQVRTLFTMPSVKSTGFCGSVQFWQPPWVTSVEVEGKDWFLRCPDSDFPMGKALLHELVDGAGAVRARFPFNNDFTRATVRGHLAAMPENGWIRITNFEDPREDQLLRHSRTTLDTSFSSDLQFLASYDLFRNRTAITLWDLATSLEIGQVPLEVDRHQPHGIFLASESGRLAVLERNQTGTSSLHLLDLRDVPGWQER